MKRLILLIASSTALLGCLDDDATGQMDARLPDWAMEVLDGFDAALTQAVRELAAAGAQDSTPVTVRDWHHVTWNNCLVENSPAVVGMSVLYRRRTSSEPETAETFSFPSPN